MGVNPYKSLHAAGAPGIASWRRRLYGMLQCTSQGKGSADIVAALEDREKQLMAAAML